jgi:hypothetical protein
MVSTDRAKVDGPRARPTADPTTTPRFTVHGSRFTFGISPFTISRLTAFLAALLVAPFAVAQGTRDPAPMPGLDPGGVMVALIGRGVDYTRPGMANRLARDGEGEIIGFDLIDRDRRPFCRTGCEAVTDAAMALLAAAPQSRLAVFRVEGAAAAAPAVQMAAQATAAIVVLDLPQDATTAALVRAATTRFPDTLIVLAPRPAAPPTPVPSTPSALPPPAAAPPVAPAVEPDTVVVATPCPPTGAAAMPGCPPSPPPTDGAPAVAEAGLARAAAVAAAAARIVAASPSTRGAALKARLAAPAE